MKVYTVRIVYKSGYTHDFDVTEFKYKGTTYTWNAYEETNNPVLLGVDDIAAVWQIDVREVEDAKTS